MSLNIQAAIDAAFAEKEAEIAASMEEIANLRQDLDVLNDGIDERDAEILRLKTRIAELEAGQPVPEPEPEPEPEEPAPQPRFPDASNTGVPEGTALAAYTGPVNIPNGTVIEGRRITKTVFPGMDVIFRKCHFQVPAPFAIDSNGQNKRLTVEDCTFVGPGYSMPNNAAIAGSGTFLRNNISKYSNGMTLNTGKSVIKGNFIHTPESGGSDPHYDGIEVYGGQTDLVVEGNTILCTDTSGVYLSDNYGAIPNARIVNNYIATQPGRSKVASPIKLYGKHGGGVPNCLIEGNHIERGYYGWYIDADPSVTPTVRGNVDAVTGKPI